MDNNGGKNYQSEGPFENDEQARSDLQRWISGLCTENRQDAVANSRMDATTIVPNQPNQTTTINTGTGLRSPAIQSQGGMFAEMMPLTSLPPISTTIPTRSGFGISQTPNFFSNQDGQSSHGSSFLGTKDSTTNQKQGQPSSQTSQNNFWQQIFKQIPLTNYSNEQQNIIFGHQNNHQEQLHRLQQQHAALGLQSNITQQQHQISQPMQNFQESWRNMSLNFQRQAETHRRAAESEHHGLQRSGVVGDLSNALAGSVNIRPPSALDPSDWRVQAYREILRLREKYLAGLFKIRSDAQQARLQVPVNQYSSPHLAPSVEASQGCPRKDMQWMIQYLTTPSPDMLPSNKEKVLNDLKIIEGRCSLIMNSDNAGPSQPPINNYGGIKFNQNSHSRNPQKGSISSSLKNPFSSGLGVSRLGNQPQQSTDISATSASSYPTFQFDHQKVKQNLQLETIKQQVNKVNEPNGPKVGPLMSSSHPRILQNFNPSSPKAINLNADSSSSQHSACLPFFTSPSRFPEKQYSRGIPPLLTADGQTSLVPAMAGPSGHQKIEKTQGASGTRSGEACTRLIKAVNSISQKALSSSMLEIHSVIKMMDTIPEAPPTNLVGALPQNGADFQLEFENETGRKMRRDITATPLYHSSPEFSDFESFRDYFNDGSNMGLTEGTSMNKRPKVEKNNKAIVKEVRSINQKLVETSLNVVLEPDEKDTSKLRGREGTIVNCMFKLVCFPEIARLRMPDFVLQLLVSVDYPSTSPIILDTFLSVPSQPSEKLFQESVSRFNLSLRQLPQPMSIEAMAGKWTASARSVLTEFAEKSGGKSFTSTYGSWERVA